MYKERSKPPTDLDKIAMSSFDSALFRFLLNVQSRLVLF